jgi:hypothetical protein
MFFRVLTARVFYASFWVRHGTPKFIEISSAQIIRQFGPNGKYEPDTLDALLRRFQQPRANHPPPDWRIFIETDFAVNTSKRIPEHSTSQAFS